MDISKAAVDWAKAEVLSSTFFIAFGLMFIAAGIGFWQIGKTDVARAFPIPLVVTGALILLIGLGTFFPNQTNVSRFAADHAQDPAAFVTAEVERTDAIHAQYALFVYKVFPAVIGLCALLFIVLHGPVWRASLLATIAMLAVILIIDTNANTRLEAYRGQLEAARGGGT